MPSDFLCHKEKFEPILEDELCALLQPFVPRPFPGHLPDDVVLTTGEPLGFSFRPPRDTSFAIWVGRDHRTPGMIALLRALADAGFLLHYSGTDGYIDPYSDEWTKEMLGDGH